MSERAWEIGWLNIAFSWNYTNCFDSDTAKIIVEQIEQIASIDYAYGYPATSNLDEFFEDIIKKSWWGMSSSSTKNEIKWRDSITYVNRGIIKKLYPFNIFNPKQIEFMESIHPRNKQILNNKSEIWELNESEQKEVVKTSVL